MSQSSAAFRRRAAFAAALLALPFAAASACDDEVRVTVVAVLACEKGDKIDPKLECLAKEVQKIDSKLTAFRIAVLTTKALAVGGKDDFDLGGDQTLRVAVEEKNDNEGRMKLIITPPRMGPITYTTTCGKFFPVMTPYRTKSNELLIVGVRVLPCDDK